MTLADGLRALRPNGWAGLEGLVAQLLGKEFELRPVVEPSGAQHGRDIGFIDMKTGLPAPIDVEVKRYQDGHTLNKRELMGELTEARRKRPQTELWVLVATIPVATSLVDELQDEAFRNGFDLLVLDLAPNGVSALELLLARHEDVALAWLEQQPGQSAKEWAALIAAVRAQPAFVFQAEDFGEQLKSRYAPHVAHAAARAWLVDHVEGLRIRVDGMNQALGRAGHAPTISRPRIAEGCRAWLEDRRSQPGMLALLGAEGDGKTWAAIDLLISADTRTPLIVTSNMFDDGGAESLIAKALARYCGGEEDRWRARLAKSGATLPRDLKILLLIDGLNEAPHRQMDSVLIDLLNGPWGSAVDVVITCRTPFWTQRVEPYLRAREEQIDLIEIGAFDYKNEWPVAREHLGSGVASLPPATAEALRNPRLWSFAYDLKDQLGGIEEITLERLLVEYWRLRYAERGDLRVGPLEFNRLIASAAQRLQAEAQPTVLFEPGDLDDMLKRMLPSVGTFDEALAEMCDGVFFSSTRMGGLKLRTDRVPVALGMLLARTVIDAGEINPQPEHVRRAAAVFLDDLPASDRVELIIRTAIVALLSVPGDHSLVLPTLLRHWVTLQNFESDFYRALAIVAGAAPHDVIRAIEDEAGEDEFVGDAAGELAQALIGRRDRDGIADILVAASERWLRSYSGELMPGLDTVAPELMESPVRWIAALDDWASALLAHLPIERWTGSLAHWARRRVALEALYPETYRYDQELRWLGMSGQHSEAELCMLIDGAAALVSNTAGGREALEKLISGDILAEWSRSVAPDLNLPRWDEIGTMLDTMAELGPGPNDAVPFLAVYRDESSNSTEHWLQLERALLEQDPGALAGLVRSQLRQALAAVFESEVGGFAQFSRDHTLLLGEAVQPLVQRYVERSRAATDDRGGLYFAGRAIPALFLGASPDNHAALLAGLGPIDLIEKVDLTGYTPRHAAAPDVLDDSTLRAWIAGVQRPTAVPPAVRDRLIEMLRDETYREDWREIARALRVSADADVAKAVAESGLDAASVGGTGAARHLSPLIIAGTAKCDYTDLRRRVIVTDLGLAATLDGTAEAAQCLANDFDALLGVHGGTEIGLGGGSRDFRSLPLAREGGRRARETGNTESLALTKDATGRILGAITRHQPDYADRLGCHLETLTDGAFAATERATFLISILAEGFEPPRAHSWMRRLLDSDHGMTDHHGLLVPTPLIFAFSPGRDADALRHDIADRAWNDADLVHLVCAAELGGFESWLDAWIEHEAESTIRSRRIRAIVLRGWRGSLADLNILEGSAARDGYGRFFAEIACVRARRRIKADALLADYENAASDAEAWLAFRSLIHQLDRRHYVDSWRRGWPDRLSRERALNHTLMLADDERLFRRIEGDLTRSFGGIVHPTQIPPWSVIETYREGG